MSSGTIDQNVKHGELMRAGFTSGRRLGVIQEGGSACFWPGGGRK